MIALLGGFLVGACLGLLGSGGSILAVPVLVYLMGHHPKVAVAESLAIVGAIAALSAIRPIRTRRIDWWSVLLFGIPGVVGTVAGVGISGWMTGRVQLLILAVVMLLAAVPMWRGRREGPDAPSSWRHRRRSELILLGVEGLVVGAVTGIVGVGGGFLIVPALVVLGRLPMQLAVGTSLLVIVLKSLIGFLFAFGQLPPDVGRIDPVVIAIFVVFGGLGGQVGGRVGAWLPEAGLRRVFAGCLVLMAVGILVRETLGPVGL